MAHSYETIIQFLPAIRDDEGNGLDIEASGRRLLQKCHTQCRCLRLREIDSDDEADGGIDQLGNGDAARVSGEGEIDGRV